MDKFSRFTTAFIGSALLVIGFLLALIYVFLIWPLMVALAALSNCFRKLWAVQRMEQWGRKLWRRWRSKTHYI